MNALFMKGALHGSVTMKNAIALCATITAFFLIFREGSGPKVADILLAFTGILVLADRESRAFIKKLWPKMRRYAYCFIAIFCFIVFAQAIQFFATGANPLQTVTLGLYARFIFETYAFFLAAFLVAFDGRLLRWMSAAIFVSPAAMLQIYFEPSVNWYMSGSRLAGYLKNPIVLGGWLMVIFFIGLGFFLETQKTWKKAALALWLIIIANFILWSGTRASWLALWLGILCWAALECVRRKNTKTAAYLIAIPLAAFFFGYLLLGQTRPDYNTKSFITERITAFITHPFSQEGNTSDWLRGVPLLAAHPLGFGLVTPSETSPRPDTNTFLELSLYGGIGALITFFIFLGQLGGGIKTALWHAKKNAPESLISAWCVAAPAVIVTTLFTDSFYFRLVWITLGIAAGIIWTYCSASAYNIYKIK